jgi:hypothetical protein
MRIFTDREPSNCFEVRRVNNGESVIALGKNEERRVRSTFREQNAG